MQKIYSYCISPKLASLGHQYASFKFIHEVLSVASMLCILWLQRFVLHSINNLHHIWGQCFASYWINFFASHIINYLQHTASMFGITLDQRFASHCINLFFIKFLHHTASIFFTTLDQCFASHGVRHYINISSTRIKDKFVPTFYPDIPNKSCRNCYCNHS